MESSVKTHKPNIRKNTLIILIAAAAAFGLYCVMFPFLAWNRSKPFDGKALMRIDPSDARHAISAVVDKAQAKFAGLYWVYGFENPFENLGQISLANFYADIRKDGDGYSIQEIMMDVQYTEGQYLYTQQIHILQNWVTSSLNRQSLEGLVVFQDGPMMQSFLDKLDRLDFQKLASMLPECDGHMINMTMPSDVLIRSHPGGVARYLVNADGTVVKSGEDKDTPIGGKVPVIMVNAAYKNGNTYGGDEVIELYLNN